MIFNQTIAGGSTSPQMYSLTRSTSVIAVFDYDSSTFVASDKQVAAGDRVIVQGEAAVPSMTYTYGGTTHTATKLSSQTRTGFIAVFTMPEADTVVGYGAGPIL